MSKTDKTNPHWVKIRRRDVGIREYHEHHGKYFHGVCELVDAMPMTRRGKEEASCEAWVSYYGRWGHKIFGRTPKRATRKLLGFEGKNRGELLRLRRLWKLEPIREDIDSSWAAPRRRCQVRDPWNWD